MDKGQTAVQLPQLKQAVMSKAPNFRISSINCGLTFRLMKTLSG
jgi:hypothetical protein